MHNVPISCVGNDTCNAPHHYIGSAGPHGFAESMTNRYAGFTFRRGYSGEACLLGLVRKLLSV